MKLFFTVFWRSMRQHKALFVITVFFTVLLSSLWVAEPLFGRYAIDELLNLKQGDDIDFISLFGMWLGIYAAVSITQGIMFYLRWRIQNYLLTDVREYYYEHMLGLDVHHHVKARGGELMKKLDNAADAAVDLTRQMLLELPTSCLTAIAFYCISFSISWKLALIALSMIPVYMILITISVRTTKKHFYTVNDLWSKSIGRGYDALSNIFSVKSSASESLELSKMKTLHKDGLSYLNKANISWALLEGIGYFMLLRILLIAFGMMLYVRGELSLGSVFFFQFGFFRMVVPMEMLSHSMPWWNEKIGKIKLAEDAFGLDVFVKSKDSTKSLPDFKGSITFSDVSFSYETADAISNISLDVQAGEHIAIVGHSGAGKSTIAMLLNRFYDVSSGAILIDGVDIRDLDIHWWRSQVGLVLQENIMFNDSVLDNIRYSRRDATEQEVYESAKRASAHEFIQKLPEQYETLIGERGIRLSGGERQRVAIARAILKQPKIVVLDEATSALDSVTEQKVQHGIAELIKDRTAFIIAHRLSTVRSVSRIMVLEDGKLIAFDTHENLLQSSDVYKEMVELQSHGMLAE